MDLMTAPATAVEAPTTRAATASPPRPARLGRLFLFLLALTFVLRFPAFVVPVFNSDETFLGTQAHVINHGGSLYQEATDRKPPLVPYLYAATFSFFGTSALWSVRLVAMLAVALTALLLALEARRRYGARYAWVAGTLFVFAMVAFAPQDGQAANFEVFMLPAMTAAVLLARRGRAVSSGAAVAVATLAKQTGMVTLLPVVYLLARSRGRRGVTGAMLGFAIPLGLVSMLVGPSQLLYWAVLGNGSYLSVGSASAFVAGMFVLMTLGWASCNAPLLSKLPRAWRDRHRRALDGDHDVDIWLWFVSAAFSVGVGLRFFGHYYIQLVPPLALIVTGALARGPRRALRRTVAAAAVFAIAFSAAGYFMHPFGPEPKYQSVSRYLADHTGPNDRILVWGSVPEIYWASNKLPATRFLTTGTFLTGNHPGRPQRIATPSDDNTTAWGYFLDDFAMHPPRYVLDTSTANVRGAEYYPISSTPLYSVLEQLYRPADIGQIDGITIYVRK
jgi:4-amino-4-deoxy-L-arabinose transferase-like glycosyltransferase